MSNSSSHVNTMPGGEASLLLVTVLASCSAKHASSLYLSLYLATRLC